MDFNYEDKVEQATNYINKKLSDIKTVFGIVLGSGLSNLSESI